MRTMPATIDQREGGRAGGQAPAAPARPLDAASVRAAYRRWAGVYDSVFGLVSKPGRMRAVAAINALPAEQILEVGVGTGLALPHYAAGKRVTESISAPRCSRSRSVACARVSPPPSRGSTRWTPRR